MPKNYIEAYGRKFYGDIINCGIKCAKRNSDSIPRPSWIGRDYGKHPLRIFHVGMNPILNENDDFTRKDNYQEFRERYLGDKLNSEGTAEDVRVDSYNNDGIKDEEGVHHMFNKYSYISSKLIDKDNPLNYAVIGNVVKCQSTKPDTHPTTDMIKSCWRFLEYELELLKPNIFIIYTKSYGLDIWDYFESEYKLKKVKENLVIVTSNSKKIIFAITYHPAARISNKKKYGEYRKLAEDIAKYTSSLN